MVGKRFSMITAVLVSLAFLAPQSASYGAYPESAYSATSISAQARPYLPVRLRIPKIKVNAAVQYVGLTSSGAVGVPNGRADVAWYKLGPRPGAEGSAVIVGHTGQKPGPATVFDNLPKLRKGDVVYVKDAKGHTFTFIVSQVRAYAPDAIVPEVFNSTGGSHLNLVTCEGVWSNAEHGFTKRLVVFTDIKQ